LDSTGSGQGPVAGCCECGDEHSGSCATELVLVSYAFIVTFTVLQMRIVLWFHSDALTKLKVKHSAVSDLS
jgi:hypothetical protein